MVLVPSAENIRSEVARHRLSREAVCSLIGMHVNMYSMFANGIRPMTEWAAHNIAWSINTPTGMMLFGIDMDKGPVRAPRGRPNRKRRPSYRPARRQTF